MHRRAGSKFRRIAAGTGVGLCLASGVASAQDDVFSFTVTSRSEKNVLAWQNPENPPYGGTRIIGRTDRFPVDANDTVGAFVADVVGTLSSPGTVTHESLANGAPVFYGAFVSDGGSSFSPGRFVSGTPFDTSGSVKWRFTPAASAVSMTPPGIGAAILFPNNNGSVYAVERGAAGGTWPQAVHPTLVGSPVQHRPPVITLAGVVAADRFTLLSSQDGFVRAVDVDTGNVLWTSADLGALQAGPGAWLSGFGGLSDLVLVGTRNEFQDNVLFALDAGGGQEAWRFDDALGTGVGIVNGGPSIDYSRSRVYFACHERSAGADTVFAVDLVTGAKVWSAAVGSVSGSPIVRGHAIYVGGDDGKIYGLHVSDGSEKLNFPFNTNDGGTKGFVFPDFAGDRLYAATQTTIWAIRDVEPTANKRWSHSGIPGASIVLYPPGSRYLWVGSSDGRLYQIDVTTGNPAQPPTATWIVLGDGSAGVGSPSYDVLHGLIYVGTEDGSLYAVAAPF